MRRIWVGNDEAACVSLCLGFKEAGITYEVSQDVKSRRPDMQRIWRYELAVAVADEERAKSLLDLPDTVVEEDSENTEEGSVCVWSARRMGPRSTLCCLKMRMPPARLFERSQKIHHARDFLV
jgi:hypothetical protein